MYCIMNYFTTNFIFCYNFPTSVYTSIKIHFSHSPTTKYLLCLMYSWSTVVIVMWKKENKISVYWLSLKENLPSESQGINSPKKKSRFSHTMSTGVVRVAPKRRVALSVGSGKRRVEQSTDGCEEGSMWWSDLVVASSWQMCHVMAPERRLELGVWSGKWRVESRE